MLFYGGEGKKTLKHDDVAYCEKIPCMTEIYRYR